jgi:signal transduction histidine kinase
MRFSRVHNSQQPDRAEFFHQMDMALHNLSQPLTVLQCRLAVGELSGEPGAMREAIHEALRECTRLNGTVNTMRSILQQAMANEENEVNA